jgi:peptidoglycan/LPS O-acetylase OafA/YrhL
LQQNTLAIPLNADAPSPPRIRLHFLDGLRGLAALYVVLFHIARPEKLTGALAAATSWMDHGRYAVDIFIVLSGFCLMLPVARDLGAIRGGAGQFFRRRAMRILPPYYAALALTILLIVATQLKKHGAGGSVWSALTPGNIGAHLLMLHNLKIDWAQTLDPPMWSVATEWQIYFAFPFLLLPVWKKLGGLAVIVCGLVLGLLPHYLLPAGQNLDWAYPWYLGLFAMGMAAASVAFSPDSRSKENLSRMPWGVATVLLGAAVVVINVVGSLETVFRGWPTDVVIGCFATTLILYCVQKSHSHSTNSPIALRIFDSAAARKLGEFSYSLYLMHFPLWWTMQPAFRALHLSPEKELVARCVIGIPVVLGLSYLFYLAVERPYLASRERSQKQKAQLDVTHAVVSEQTMAARK